MYEVRIYDVNGKLKKIITPKMLEKRSQLICSDLLVDKKTWSKKLLRFQQGSRPRKRKLQSGQL